MLNEKKKTLCYTSLYNCNHFINFFILLLVFLFMIPDSTPLMETHIKKITMIIGVQFLYNLNPVSFESFQIVLGFR